MWCAKTLKIALISRICYHSAIVSLSCTEYEEVFNEAGYEAADERRSKRPARTNDGDG